MIITRNLQKAKEPNLPFRKIILNLALGLFDLSIATFSF
jgi:hypothetical protein